MIDRSGRQAGRGPGVRRGAAAGRQLQADRGADRAGLVARVGRRSTVPVPTAGREGRDAVRGAEAGRAVPAGAGGAQLRGAAACRCCRWSRRSGWRCGRTGRCSGSPSAPGVPASAYTLAMIGDADAGAAVDAPAATRRRSGRPRRRCAGRRPRRRRPRRARRSRCHAAWKAGLAHRRPSSRSRRPWSTTVSRPAAGVAGAWSARCRRPR